jgi:hypothetical protein
MCIHENCEQISAGVWTLLTLNIEILPRLPLDQWQILFGIISKTGTAQSFAAVKSFEVGIWMFSIVCVFLKSLSVYGLAFT